MTRMRWARRLLVVVVALSATPIDGWAGIAIVVSAPSQAPPPVLVEKHGSAPFKNAVWVDGHWAWSNGRYSWQGGHWERVRDGAHGWQQGQWSRRGTSWFWTQGRWL